MIKNATVSSLRHDEGFNGALHVTAEVPACPKDIGMVSYPQCRRVGGPKPRYALAFHVEVDYIGVQEGFDTRDERVPCPGLSVYSNQWLVECSLDADEAQ